ncbi:MAG: response regulator [Phycisphaerae bacterium]|nr:response regulator [Phycisphaerae bacterium]
MPAHPARILFVDDEPAVLDGLRRMMRSQSHRFVSNFTDDSIKALQACVAGEVDVLVSDCTMPAMDGFALITQLRATPEGRRVPVIFLSGRQEAELKREALDLDAADLLSKPVQFEELLARLRNALRIKTFEDELNEQNARLDRRVLERTAALEDSRREILWRLAKAGELRDEQTGHHVLRVAWYSFHVAKALRLDDDYCGELLIAAPLHDVGKIGIPDHILRKPGPLTAAECAVMQEHCRIGEAILRERPPMAMMLERMSPNACADPVYPALAMAARIALGHHERWDGRGYPRELRGDQTPREARIVAVADAFDAICAERPYKPALPFDHAVSVIRAEAGAQFDPVIVRAFESAIPAIRVTQAKLADDATALELVSVL